MKSIRLVVGIILLVAMFSAGVFAQGVTLTHIETTAAAEWIGEMANLFKEKTGITVEVTIIPLAQIQETLLIRGAAGVAPDTSRLLPDTMPMAARATVDLNPFVERDRVDRALFPFGAFDFVTVKSGPDQGKLQVLPHSVWSYAVSHNVTLFNERGVAAPAVGWTWDDMLETARRFPAREEANVASVALPLDWTRLGVLVHHAGGQWLTSPDNPTESRLLSSEVRTAMEYVDSLYQANAVHSHSAFQAGNAALNYSAGPNEATLIQRATASGQEPFEFAWSRFPRGPSNNTGAEIQLHTYAIMEGTNHPQEAWEWLKFLSLDEENQVRYYRSSGLIPGLRPAAQRFFEEQAHQHPSILVFLDYFFQDTTTYMRPMGWAPSGAHFQQWIRRAILERNVSLEEALIQADQAINAQLSRN